MTRQEDFEARMEAHPYRTGMATAVKVALALLVLGVVFIVLGFAFSWFSAGVNVVSPANVREQYRFGYDFDRAMRSSAENVCVAERRHLEPATIAAYEQTYNNTRASYDARMADAFRAKHVKPGDLPLEAPSLAQREQEVCR